MATSTKCGNKQREKKTPKTSPKRSGQMSKKKLKMSSSITSKKANLKSAYVALEYKHFHNIGSRKAAEQVITYDESVPIYQSQIGTDCNGNRISLSPEEPNNKHCNSNMCQNSKNLGTMSKIKTSPKYSKPNIDLKKTKLKIKKNCNKGVKKKTRGKQSKPGLPSRREASLNATAKLNILYHESDIIRGVDLVDTSEDETLSAILKSLATDADSKPAKVVKKSSPSKSHATKSSLIKRKLSEKEKSAKKLLKSKATKSSDVNSVKSKEKGKKKSPTKLSPNKKAKKLKFKKAKIRISESELDLEMSGPKYARRMASLNAEAIMAVSWTSSNTQKAARTEALEAARTQVYVSPKKEAGRWVEGRGEEVAKAIQNSIQIPWTDREVICDSSIKDYPFVSNIDPLQLNNNNVVPTVDIAPSIELPICHSYQSPIHINVEDCGPYAGSHSNAPHIANPMPRYPYPSGHSGVASGQCQSYTLGAMGSLSNVQMMPFHQTYNSAFTVPCNHGINVPCNHGNACSLSTPYYGYVHNNYYGGGSSLLQPLSEPPCMLPRPVQCPQAEVKVLIHNPHSTDHPFLRQSEDSSVTGPVKLESLTPTILSSPIARDTGTTIVFPLTKPTVVKEASCNQKPQTVKVTPEQGKKDEHQTVKKIKKKADSASKCQAKKVKKSDSKSSEKDKQKKKDSPKKKTEKSEQKRNKKKSEKKNKILDKTSIKKPAPTCTLPSPKSKPPETSFKKDNKKEEPAKCPKECEVVLIKADSMMKKDKAILKKEESNNKIKRRRNSHGWSWIGTPEAKKIISPSETAAVERPCYCAMKHVDGDVIHTGDCVLLCAGPRRSDVPYVAKVTNLWENTEDGEMMLSLLWYYRPEHTESGRRPNHMDVEVFASKHRDENSVACIEDKCYVLTYNEYCRYRANLKFVDDGCYRRLRVVPEQEGDYPRSSLLPPLNVDPECVMLCRQVYDFRQKRVLKNPS